MSALLTIFSTPKPFSDPHVATIQTNALNSWVHIGNQVKVVLIGDEVGVAQAARKACVKWIPDVRRNRLGTPLISSIFQLARDNSDSPLMVFLNADILLTSPFVSVAEKVFEQSSRFLVVGRRWDLDLKQALDFSGMWEAHLEKLVGSKARLHPAGGSDYFIFPRDCFQSIPDLAIGRAGWDNWMIYEARRRGWQVVDATPTYKVIHQQHDYSHLPGGEPHYRLPESEENVNRAGGRHAIYTLADANWVLVNGKLEKAPLRLKRLLRELEILPLTRFHSVWAAKASYAVFHPLRTYWRLRIWLSKVRRRNQAG